MHGFPERVGPSGTRAETGWCVPFIHRHSLRAQSRLVGLAVPACSLHPHLRHPVGAAMSLSVHSQCGKPARSLAAGLGEGREKRRGAGPPGKQGRRRLHGPQGTRDSDQAEGPGVPPQRTALQPRNPGQATPPLGPCSHLFPEKMSPTHWAPVSVPGRPPEGCGSAAE